jgi:hypothetical protein
MLNACVNAILCTCRHIKSGAGLTDCLHSTLSAAAAPWQRAERGRVRRRRMRKTRRRRRRSGAKANQFKLICCLI